MKRSITIAGVRFRGNSLLLIFFLLLVLCVQTVPGLGDAYAMYVYPSIARVLSSFSRLVPFAIGDLFIALSIAGVLLYPVYARCIRKQKWNRILQKDIKYLLWVYVWFYLAWGLNYSQKNFYERTRIPYTAYTPDNFRSFTDSYIENLNSSYTDITSVEKELVCHESVRVYNQIGDSLGVHRPFHQTPRAKLAHLLGITSEAEANFYAYQVCTRSQVQAIRFSGYLSVLPHVLNNARRLMAEEEYAQLFRRIRPEIIGLAKKNSEYWMKKYNPVIGRIQDRIYDLYLKGNKIESGRKNYSEVVGLLISYEEWKKNSIFASIMFN